MTSKIYPSDLTDAEWQYLEPLLPSVKRTGRPRQWPLRLILDGIFYVVRSGCAWRMLPEEYPPWPTVHDYYRLMITTDAGVVTARGSVFMLRSASDCVRRWAVRLHP